MRGPISVTEVVAFWEATVLDRATNKVVTPNALRNFNGEVRFEVNFFNG